MCNDCQAMWEALALLLAECRPLMPDEPPERMIPAQHRVADLRQARTALAKGGDL